MLQSQIKGFTLQLAEGLYKCIIRIMYNYYWTGCAESSVPSLRAVTTFREWDGFILFKYDDMDSKCS